MRIPRLYLPEQITRGAILALETQAAHHVARVLRLRPGAMLRVFDGYGGEYEAVLHEVALSRVTINIGEKIDALPEPARHITLAQGIPRGDRMDIILQKAVELGTTCIQPLWMQRSRSRLKGERLEKRTQHWQGVVISACEQCGRATLPALPAPQGYPDWLGKDPADEMRILLHPQGEQTLCQLEPGDRSIVLLAGPEGGMADNETDAALIAGFTPVCMGPRILRTETAGLAALSALQTLWGDFC